MSDSCLGSVAALRMIALLVKDSLTTLLVDYVIVDEICTKSYTVGSGILIQRQNWSMYRANIVHPMISVH